MAEEEKKTVEASEEDEDLDLDDFEDEEQEEKEEKEESSKEEQDKEERARQAKLRREREAREREQREKAIKDEAYLKGQLEATKVNPYTNEPIDDEYDLKILKVQKELEKEGKDPIADLPKRLAQLNRSADLEAKKEESARKEREDAIDNDIKDFKSKYPKVDIFKLLNDQDFKDYSDGRLGVKGGKSLAQIYEDFERFKSKYTKKEEESHKAPPSPNGGRKTEKTSYSEMSEEQRIAELKRQGLI